MLLSLILYFGFYVYFLYFCQKRVLAARSIASGAFSYLNDSQTFLKFIVDTSI